MGNLLDWLGGPVAVRVQVATGFTSDTTGTWDVGEWDVHTWGSSNLAWQDVTHLVEGVSINRGQERWGSRFSAGTALITLDNDSGVFTPGSGNTLVGVPWRPGRGIRVIAIVDDVVFPLFTGRVTSSNDLFAPAGERVVTRVGAIDAMGEWAAHNPLAQPFTGVQSTHARVHAALDVMDWPDERRVVQEGEHTMQTSQLAQSTLEECQRAAEAEGGAFFADVWNNAVFKNRDWLNGVGGTPEYEVATLAKHPIAYYRFSGSSADADSTSNGHTLSWSGSPSTEQAGVTADDEAVELDGVNDFATVLNEVDLELRQDMSIEMWFKPAAKDATIISCRASSNPLWEISYASGNEHINFWPHTGAGVGFSTAHGSVPADEWCHLVVTIAWNDDNTRTITAWVNGRLDRNVTTSYLPDSEARTVNIGRRAIGNDEYFDGSLSELVFYDYVLSADQVQNQFLSSLRSANYRSAETQGWIGYAASDKPGEPTADVLDVQVSWEDARIVNHVAFARVGSTAYETVDLPSIQTYGKRSYTRFDFYNNSDSEVEFLADRYLSVFKDNRMRIEGVTISPNGGVNTLFYDAQLGDLVNVKVQTLRGWELSAETHIVGIQHDITPDDWLVSFRLDDAAVWINQSS